MVMSVRPSQTECVGGDLSTTPRGIGYAHDQYSVSS